MNAVFFFLFGWAALLAWKAENSPVDFSQRILRLVGEPALFTLVLYGLRKSGMGEPWVSNLALAAAFAGAYFFRRIWGKSPLLFLTSWSVFAYALERPEPESVFVGASLLIAGIAGLQLLLGGLKQRFWLLPARPLSGFPLFLITGSLLALTLTWFGNFLK